MAKLKCIHCKSYNDKESSFKTNVGNFCDHGCAAKWAEVKRDNDRAKSKVKQEKTQRSSDRKRKKELMTKTEWLNKLQVIVNKYVRLRDSNDGCISCDKQATWSGQWHASHYISRGHSSFLRFNLWNIHKSCSTCNSHLSGNIGQYTPRLIEKIGQEKVDWIIENKSNIVTYDIAHIERAIKIARKAVKRLDNRI